MTRARQSAGLAALGAAGLLCAAAPAAGAPGTPEDVRPTTDFVREAPCVSSRLLLCLISDRPLPITWDAVAFTAGSTARRYLVDPIVDIEGADPAAVIVDDPAATGAALPVTNGHQYQVRVYASESVNGVTSVSTPVERAFRIDETPPTATLTIAGGAAFTRTREVPIAVPASDPPTAGSFDASGLGGLAAWSGPTPSLDQIAVPYQPTATVTLAAGPDGPRNVTAVVFDRSRHPLSQPATRPPFSIDLFPITPVTLTPIIIPPVYQLPTRPFTPRPQPILTDPVFRQSAATEPSLGLMALEALTPRVVDRAEIAPVAAAPPPPVGARTNGNSTSASDEIVLDTTPPVASVAVTPSTSPAGVPVSLSAAASSDATSGLDPATATWTFGDATAAGAGLRVSHTYAAPGSYSASLSLSDRAGNVAVTPFTVKVGAAITTDGGAGTNPVGGARTTGIRPSLSVRTSIGTGFSNTSARLDARWRESVLVGRITVKGRTLRALKLVARLRPRDARLGPPRVLAERLRLGKGPVDSALRLPAGLLPGDYDLDISSTAGPELRRVLSLRIPAPREGVASSAVVALSPSGAALRSVPAGTRRMFARFRLAALPASGQVVAVTWYHPDGPAVGTSRKARAARVVSFVRSSEALPSGRWRAVLRAGGTRVAEASVRVP